MNIIGTYKINISVLYIVYRCVVNTLLFHSSSITNVHRSLHTHHVPRVQDPEKLEVLVELIKSTGHLLGLTRGRVEGNAPGSHELLQVGPLQRGHPLKCA